MDGGNRAAEFRHRLNSASHEDIAKAGGGIASTVKANRAATEIELLAHSTPRWQASLEGFAGRLCWQALLAGGVTTVEIISGDGLAVAHKRIKLPVLPEFAHSKCVVPRGTVTNRQALKAEFTQAMRRLWTSTVGQSNSACANSLRLTNSLISYKKWLQHA